MTDNQIDIQAVHHLTLTVSDVARSREFYVGLFGFDLAGEFGERVVLIKGNTLLALGPAPDPSRAQAGDSFDENRVGLDHFSFGVRDQAELERAVGILDANGVDHGEIVNLAPFGIDVLMFRDPDNIQVELTAPHG